MAFRLAWRTRAVMRMVPEWPESGFRGEPPGWTGELGRQRRAAAGRAGGEMDTPGGGR
jgi:hypothetical protein